MRDKALLTTSPVPGHYNLICVYLTLPNGKSRHIGHINRNTNTFQTVRNKNHLFRKMNALGISYDLLKSHLPFTLISINYEGKEYKILRSKFLNEGQCLNFKQQGFELQLFLPLTSINL